MKVLFSSQAQKDNALAVAERAGLENCGKMYIYMIDGAEIDETLVETKVEEESLVDEKVEQITV